LCLGRTTSSAEARTILGDLDNACCWAMSVTPSRIWPPLQARDQSRASTPDAALVKPSGVPRVNARVWPWFDECLQLLIRRRSVPMLVRIGSADVVPTSAGGAVPDVVAAGKADHITNDGDAHRIFGQFPRNMFVQSQSQRCPDPRHQ
jgi:hypothetical protein